MSGRRLAHVVAEFDYPYGTPDGPPESDQAVIDAIHRIIVSGLWRSALSDFPTITVTLKDIPKETIQ